MNYFPRCLYFLPKFILSIFFLPMLFATDSSEVELIHRSNSIQMIRSAVEQIRDKNVLYILGAGQCSEMPIEELCTIFKSIYLFDIHPQECNSALRRKNLNEKENIHVINLDLSFGFSDFINSRSEEFICTVGAEIVDYHNNNPASMFEPFLKPLSFNLIPGIKPDMVISSLLVSQILNAKKMSNLFAPYGTAEILVHTPLVLDRLNDICTKTQSLLHSKMLKELNPVAIYYADTLGIESGSPCERNLFANIKNELLHQYEIYEQASWEYQYTDPLLSTTVSAIIFMKKA